MEIKNLDKVAQRIIKATKNKEKILVYGDADLDGIASVVILKEILEILNPDYNKKEFCYIYFSDREREGYGITESLIDFCSETKPDLIFALDCGISNFNQVDKLRKMGIEVVIIDHHKILERLPKANLIIDPKQKGDKYPFKDLSTAGLVYYLAKAVFLKAQKKWSPDAFLELASIATLADQMPLKEDNQKIVREGLLALPYTKREGLRILMELTDFQNQDSTEIFQKIIAPLNSSERVGHLTKTYLVLSETSKEKVRALVKDLIARSLEKREKINQILLEVQEKIEKTSDKSSPVIFEADSSWPIVIIGIVASKIAQQYKKPTFLFKITGEESVGSARLPKGLDGVEAMASCKDLLITYGGHSPACGCRLKTKNLEKFRDCLVKYFKSCL
jgi:single-stranded-DNA-specific exonuclease